MPASYSTPGVYVEEISTFPPSVAEVSTAIPAFLGYTEKGPTLAPTRLTTLREYEALFGGAPTLVKTVSVGADGTPRVAIEANAPLLYYSLRLYFDNGGGPCYVVSLGAYTDTTGAANLKLDDFDKGLVALEREDEPTLIVMPDAVRLQDTGASAVPGASFGQACAKALGHCGKQRDRFAILDTQDLPDATKLMSQFRDRVSSDYLSYGAAYAPHLSTALTPDYAEGRVTVTQPSVQIGGLRVAYGGDSPAHPKVKIESADATSFSVAETGEGEARTATLTVKFKSDATPDALIEAWAAWAGPKKGFGLAAGKGSLTASAPVDVLTSSTLDTLRTTDTALYNQVRAALGRERVTLPPSGAMAGIYARVDRDRGVWKAPANVAVASTIALTRTFTDEEQGRMNIDPTSGKSINAIRSFVGRGTLVWGARTLAGNDNEWRYVPVRRLFIMIEESAQKSTAFAVFEPNTAETWLKVKAMIESFLYGLWERGALAGSKPEAAYFVNVGLGTTMTAQNILEGLMIVEIGIAAVRPAEFIILRFSHKMQEA